MSKCTFARHTVILGYHHPPKQVGFMFQIVHISLLLFCHHFAHQMPPHDFALQTNIQS